ncbi:MAG: translation initiation factor IF-1 [Candidatus Zambryskibacteria bacterium]|nr:translation initiation factor IF-1 [Candidatus Zambryskibacteria bacterium]
MHNQDKKQDKMVVSVSGVVIEALPNTFFRVRRDDTGEEMLTYLSGKMRLHRIRVLVGDKVIVELEPYGGKGRIVKRT